MNKDKMDDFVKLYSEALVKVSDEFTGMIFTESEKCTIEDKKTYTVIIGVVGNHIKGRVILEAGSDAVKAITQAINGEPLENMMETYLYMGEYTNTICGRAVTWINNKYRGNEFRLSPPAIYGGINMVMDTPNIPSRVSFFQAGEIIVSMNIGFEGE